MRIKVSHIATPRETGNFENDLGPGSERTSAQSAEHQNLHRAVASSSPAMGYNTICLFAITKDMFSDQWRRFFPSLLLLTSPPREYEQRVEVQSLFFAFLNSFWENGLFVQLSFKITTPVTRPAWFKMPLLLLLFWYPILAIGTRLFSSFFSC